MAKILVSLFLIVFGSSASAQLLSLPQGNAIEFTHKFNPQVIADNGISEIKCTIERKPDGAKISKSFQSEVFRFDSLGRTNYLLTTNSKLRDSLVTIFTFVGNKLDCEIKNDAAGMFSYCYIYDEEGQITQQKYGRVPQKALEGPNRNTKITTENFTHAEFDNQHHTTLFNAAGRPYRKEIRYFDENGYLIKYLRTYVMSHSRQEESYIYESHGWLAEKTVDDGKESYTLKFEYDSVGNLLSELKFSKGKVIHRREFLYHPETMLLKAELKRDELEQMIIIVNYDYSFQGTEG